MAQKSEYRLLSYQLSHETRDKRMNYIKKEIYLALVSVSLHVKAAFKEIFAELFADCTEE